MTTTDQWRQKIADREAAYTAASEALAQLAVASSSLYAILSKHAPQLATHTWTLDVVHEALDEHVQHVLSELEGP